MKSGSMNLIEKLILSVCMVVPLSVDIFISGIPSIQAFFPNNDVALILSVTIFGLAFSQLIYGPLLDRFGRKPVLLAGLFLFTVASFIVLFASTFTTLIAARFLQAVGGCSGTVAVFAIVKDTHNNEDLLSSIAMIMAMIGISPIIAPLVGSFLNSYLGWRGSFGFLCFLGIFYILLISVCFKETIKAVNPNALKLTHIVKNYLNLLRDRIFIVYSLVNALTYCILFSYLNLSSIFIIEQMGIGVINYGWIVSANAVAIIAMAKCAPKIVSRISLSGAVISALIVIVVSGLIMFTVNRIFECTIYTFMIPMLLVTIGTGTIRPTASAGAMQLVPKTLAGTASACFNFISFLGGAIASSYSIKLIHHVSEFGAFIAIAGFMAASMYIVMTVSQKRLLPT